MFNDRTETFLGALEEASTLPKVWEVVGRHLDDLGLTHSIYLVADLVHPEKTRMWTSLPRFWLQRYSEKDYQSIDPFFRYCCNSFSAVKTGPQFLHLYDWLSDEERKIILEGGECGFCSGFTAPVRLRGGKKIGGWNFGSSLGAPEMIRFISEHKSELQLLAFLVNERVERLHSHNSVVECKRLSNRESECLLWLSKGLRTAAIAERLNIAEVTVNLHFKGARTKLRSATREEALAKAVATGLIYP